MKRPRSEQTQREFAQMDIDLSALALGKNGDHIARLHPAQRKLMLERLNPFGLDPIGKHIILSFSREGYTFSHPQSEIRNRQSVLPIPTCAAPTKSTPTKPAEAATAATEAAPTEPGATEAATIIPRPTKAGIARTTRARKGRDDQAERNQRKDQ